MSFTGPGTATLANYACTVSSVTVFTNTTGVFGRNFYNGSTGVCYLTYGTASSTSAYSVQIAANTNYSFPVPTYVGVVTAIWPATNGTAYTTQW